ncbi:hypothetical protein GY12_00715 [Micrococcus luteus]|nr:hypothetical protein GY12_00715 [Micrococcus luteus]
MTTTATVPVITLDGVTKRFRGRELYTNASVVITPPGEPTPSWDRTLGQVRHDAADVRLPAP